MCSVYSCMSCVVIDGHKCQWVNVYVHADVYVVSECLCAF